MRTIVARLACVTLAFAATLANAQPWPTKPIRIVAGTGAGGAPDILSRIVAHRMGESLGQSVIVELKPGGGGVIAAEHVARAPADGYTWLVSTTTNLAVTPFLRRKLPYDTEKDFVPVSLIAWAANVLVVGKHVPAGSVAELLTIARASPGKLNYGSAGIGTPAHLAGELLGALAGISMTHVPYKGAAQALNDVVGGQIDLIMTSPVAAKVFVQNDKVKVLATTGAKRDPLLPQLAPISDTVPGYEITQWWGLMLRAGTPRPILDRVHAELVSALNDAKVREMITNQGAVAQPMKMEEFTSFIETERGRYRELVKTARIPVED